MTNNNLNGSGSFYGNSFQPQAFNPFAAQAAQSRGYVPEMICGPIYSDAHHIAQAYQGINRQIPVTNPAAYFSQPFVSNAAIAPSHAVAHYPQQAVGQQAYQAIPHAQVQINPWGQPQVGVHAPHSYSQAHGINTSGIYGFGQNPASFAPVVGQQTAYFDSGVVAGNVAQQSAYQDSHAGTWVPSINLIETNDAFSICAELAGVSEEQVEIYVQHNVVTIRGNKQATAIEQQQPVVLAERHYGPFIRTITLPVAVNNAKVRAVMKQGLLEIELPKITQVEGGLQRVKVSGKA